MRNLLGRLHARPAGDLARIALFWRVPLGDAARPSQVGTLYRAMVDPRAVRSVWDRLDPEAREMVRLLAVTDEQGVALGLAALAAALGWELPETREVAVRLYRDGILAREGDDEPLPVGTAPRLLLPRELALNFRRIQDEIEVGDRSNDSLEVLLEWLDESELEDAAARWGVQSLPGLRRREELTRRLLRQMGEPDRIRGVAAGLRPDAAGIWQRLLALPGGEAMPAASVAAEIGLGDDSRDWLRLRTALDDLEASLLVWHTFRADGSRWLFVPRDVRAPRPRAAPPLPALEAVDPEAVVAEPWRSPDAVVWDLLTVARQLTGPGAPAWPAAGPLPAAVARRLAGRLWLAAGDAPGGALVGGLVALARAAGVLVAEEEGHVARLALGPGFREWRSRSFPELTADLRDCWATEPAWFEGGADGRVEVRGVDWPGARSRLLGLLVAEAAGLAPGAWFTLESVAARLADLDPDLLGTTFTAATARVAGDVGAGGSEGEARRAAIADVLAVELEGPLRWFGIVETGELPGRAAVVRRPGAEADPPPDPVPDLAAPAVTADESGELGLRQPSPTRVWSLLTFAEPEELGPVCRFRLSAASVGRALDGGFDPGQVTAFLRRETRGTLPVALEARIDDWARGHRRVRLTRALLLAPDDEAQQAALAELLGRHGVAVRDLGPGGLLAELADGDNAPGEREIEALLREHGFHPQWRRARPR